MQNDQDKLLANIQEGKVYEGTIKAIEKYGAVVDIGGIDGLVRPSDISWEHVNDPHKFLKIKQKVNVEVLSFDKGHMQIFLGLKQLTENPWDKVDERYPIGSIHEGTVSRIEEFGCFVDLENGFRGLVYHSEMDWFNSKPDPTSIFSVGDKIEVKVLSFNKERRQIDLGMKQLTDNPWDIVEEFCPIDSIHEGAVSWIQDFGCFVKLRNGYGGLVYLSEMDWLNRKPEVSSIVSVGDEVKVKVLSFDKELMNISLGLKQLTENPWDKVGEMCSIESIHVGAVTKLEGHGCIVVLKNGFEGLVHRSEMDWLNPKPNTASIVSVGDEINVKVLSFDKEKMKISLGMKQLTDNPWDKVDEMCPIDSIQEGKVSRIESYGCLVDLDNGFSGLVHKLQMDWLNPEPDTSSIVSVGEKIKVKVLGYENERMKISLSMKQLTPNVI